MKHTRSDEARNPLEWLVVCIIATIFVGALASMFLHDYLAHRAELSPNAVLFWSK